MENRDLHVGGEGYPTLDAFLVDARIPVEALFKRTRDRKAVYIVMTDSILMLAMPVSEEAFLFAAVSCTASSSSQELLINLSSASREVDVN